MHQVRLAEAHAAVQEERVVGVTGALSDGERRGVGQAVGRADDEIAECVARVEVEAAALWSADAAGFQANLLGNGQSRRGSSVSGAVECGFLLRILGQHPRKAFADFEVDLHAVADDAGERLADE